MRRFIEFFDRYVENAQDQSRWRAGRHSGKEVASTSRADFGATSLLRIDPSARSQSEPDWAKKGRLHIATAT